MCVTNLAFPEGLSVDEAFTLFDDGFGVKKSKKMRREKIEMQKNYNAEGLVAGLAEVDVVEVVGMVDKAETSYTEKV
jgi:MFS transporter, SP family, solute carrier family 2 (myo-inositol transporter), member 13